MELYLLEGIEQIAKKTIATIHQIKDLMLEYKQVIRNNYKFYSQDLLNNLFKHPYTKIEFLQSDLGIVRLTASKYLKQLSEGGLLQKAKIGRNVYYINQPLFNILSS